MNVVQIIGKEQNISDTCCTHKICDLKVEGNMEQFFKCCLSYRTKINVFVNPVLEIMKVLGVDFLILNSLLHRLCLNRSVRLG
jgi:hypothetical protein